ncbi:MAG: very short patch repair endonuclease [Gammaproteobacteria bacterium]
MADNLTPKQRKHCMSQVHGRNTKPEIKLRGALWRAGLRYRLKSKLPGKPDIVFVSARVVVFVDGCFWHGCPVHGSIPATNKRFWKKKLKSNVERDREVTERLVELDWLVLRFWTHELKEDADRVLRDIKRAVLRRTDEP